MKRIFETDDDRDRRIDGYWIYAAVVVGVLFVAFAFAVKHWRLGL